MPDQQKSPELKEFPELKSNFEILDFYMRSLRNASMHSIPISNEWRSFNLGRDGQISVTDHIRKAILQLGNETKSGKISQPLSNRILHYLISAYVSAEIIKSSRQIEEGLLSAISKGLEESAKNG